MTKKEIIYSNKNELTFQDLIPGDLFYINDNNHPSILYMKTNILDNAVNWESGQSVSVDSERMVKRIQKAELILYM